MAFFRIRRHRTGYDELEGNVRFMGDVEFIGGSGFLLKKSVIYYVDGTNGSDSNDGLSPGAAFKTIQAAVTKQIANSTGLGDAIYIMPGTYVENVVASVFNDCSLIGISADSVIIAPVTGSAFTTGTDGVATVSMNRSLIKNIQFRAPSTEDGATAYPACLIGYMTGSVIEDCKFMGTSIAPFQNPGPATVGLQLGSRTYVAGEFPEHSRISRCEFGTSAGRNKELSIGIRVGSQINTDPANRGFKSMKIEDCIIGAYDTGILLNTGASSCGGTVIRGNVVTSHQGGAGPDAGIVSQADDGTDLLCMVINNRISAIGDGITNFSSCNVQGNIVSINAGTPAGETGFAT